LSFLFFAALFTGLAFLPFGAIAAALSLTVTFQYLPATIYRARSQPVQFLMFTGTAFVITALSTVVLLAVLHMGVVGALIGQLAGGVYVLGYSALMLWRSGGFTLDTQMIRAALRFGLPLVPHGLSGWLLNVSDRWLLGIFLPLGMIAARSAIGIYSLGYQLAYAIDLLAQSLNAAWIPFFYRYGGTPQGPGIHREMTTLMVAGFGALATILGLNASLVVAIIARPSFAEAAGLIPVLSIGFVAHVFYIAVVTVIFYAQRTAVLPLITGSSAVINVVTNIALIPVLGIQGAAWATVIAFSFMSLATTIAARRVYPMRLDWPRLLLLFTGVLAIAWYSATRRTTVTLGSVAIDAGISAVIAGAALVVAWGPMRALRGVTRAAAREA
jgi:O-antigen/teichoic acid export membrane protein